jgi:hypothetical protein
VSEHPLREIPDRSRSQGHAEVTAGALADAGLSFSARRRLLLRPLGGRGDDRQDRDSERC